MALQVRRSASTKVRLAATLISVFALVAQPFYGVATGYVAHAETNAIRQLAITTDAQAITTNEASAIINVQTQNNGNKETALDSGEGHGAVLSLKSSSATGEFSDASSSAKSCAGNWGTASLTMSAGTANKAFCYRDSKAGTYTITVTSNIPAINEANQAVLSAMQQIIVQNPITVSTPSLGVENFNTNDSDAYKGINVGFTVKDFGTVASVAVDLYQDTTKLVTNTGTAELNALINGGEKHLSTPFYIQDGSSDPYWTFGSHVWTANDKPTSAVVTVVGSNGTKRVAFSPLAEPNGWTFESLLPADTTRPTTHIDLPLDGSYSKTGNFTITGTASDAMSGVDYVSVYVAHDPWNEGGYEVANQTASFNPNTGTFTYDVSNLSEGTYVIKAVAYDQAGNAQFANGVHLRVDKTLPAAPVITTPVARQWFKTAPIKTTWSTVVDVSGIAKYQVAYRYDDGHSVGGTTCPAEAIEGLAVVCRDTASTSRNHAPALNEEGGVTIWVRAFDNAGNASAWSKSIHYSYDHTAPSSSVSSLSADGTVRADKGGNLVVTGAANDNLSLNRMQIQLVTAKHGAIAGMVHTPSLIGQGKTANWATSFKIAGLNGKYALAVKAVDMAGNVEAVYYIDFTIDNTRPSLSFTAPASFNGYVTTAPTVKVHAADANGLSVLVVHVYDRSTGKLLASPRCTADAIELAAGDLGCDLSNLPEGRYYVVAGTNDTAGNNQTIQSTDFVVDKTAPSVPVNGQPNGVYLKVNDFDFTWDASTDNSNGLLLYEFQSSMNSTVDHDGVLTSGVWESGILNGTKIHSHGAPFGAWYWQVRARDAAGNYSAWSPVWSVTLDNENPSSTNDLAAIVKDKIIITQKVADNIAAASGKLRIWKLTNGVADNTKFFAIGDKTVDANGVVSYDLDTAVNLFGDGEYIAKFTSTDKAGNASVAQQNFTVDNTRPTASITTPTNNAYEQAGNFQITGTASDDQTGVDHVNIYVSKVTAPDVNGKTFGGYVVDNQPATTFGSTTGAFTYDVSGLADGTYVIKAVAFDQAGNAHFANTVTTTVDHVAPKLTVNASNGTSVTGTTNGASDTVTVDGQAATVDRTANQNGTYNWSFTPTQSYKTGTTVVAIVSTDAAGNATQETAKVVVEPAKDTTSNDDGVLLAGADVNSGTQQSFVVTPNTDNSSIASTDSSDSAVLGTQTKKDSSTSPLSTEAVLGTNDTKDGTWNIFGLAWYWWLLIVAAAAAIIWGIIASARRASDNSL